MPTPSSLTAAGVVTAAAAAAAAAPLPPPPPPHGAGRRGLMSRRCTRGFFDAGFFDAPDRRGLMPCRLTFRVVFAGTVIFVFQMQFCSTVLYL